MDKKTAFNKITQLERELGVCQVDNINLYAGQGGMALFYKSLFDLTGETDYLEKCHNLVQNVVDKLPDHALTNTFSSGYPGILWLLEYMRKGDVVDYDPDELFKDIDDHTYQESVNDLKNGHYDFLHGGLGAALYALERLPNKKAESFLKDVVAHLDELKDQDESGIRWKDQFTTRTPEQQPYKMYNLGLSHGIPSIINILLRIYQAGICVDITRMLVDQSARWILSCKNLGEGGISLFPNAVYVGMKGGSYGSRLSWCYGDLGIAWTLWNAGKIIGNDLYKEEARQIIRASIKREDALTSENLDAGFCHGTAGIAYLFKRFYQEVDIPECKERHDFWLKKTLNLDRYEDGLAGYRMYNPLYEEKWIKCYGLLEGITGVGLVLLSDLNDSTDWDKSLLLTF